MRSALPVIVAVALLDLLGCGPKLPPRYVIERDLGSAHYRRYQQVLDVELPVEGNPAVGHTATYVTSGKIQVTPVFVTVYHHADGLSREIGQRLRAIDGYEVRPVEAAGQSALRLIGEDKDQWVVWVSGAILIKIGVPEGADDVPEELLEAYAKLYPSE